MLRKNNAETSLVDDMRLVQLQTERTESIPLSDHLRLCNLARPNDRDHVTEEQLVRCSINHEDKII